MKINFSLICLMSSLFFSVNSSAQQQEVHRNIRKSSPADAPNLACDYIYEVDKWVSTGATIEYVANPAGGPGTFNNMEMDLTVNRMGEEILYGACSSKSFNVDSKSAIFKMATYSTLSESFSFDDDCEVIENVPYKTYDHFKAPVVSGKKTEGITELLKLINYFMTPAEIKAWSKSEDVANAAAAKKCLDLFPGSVPDGSQK